jgi:uncharacterized membrane protein
LSNTGKVTTLLVVPKQFKHPNEKTARKKTILEINRKTKRRTSFSQADANHSKPDFQDKIKHFLVVGFFGNLYARFIFLVILLFFTLLAFANLVRRSIDESHRLAVSKKYSQAVAHIKEIKKRGRWTRDDIRKIRSLLVTVGKSGDFEYVTLAKNELDDLKQMLIARKHEKKLLLLDAVLEKLKKKSYEFEERGRMKEALEIWLEYRRNGPFAVELQEEINEQVHYLKNKLPQSSVESDGIK